MMSNAMIGPVEVSEVMTQMMESQQPKLLPKGYQPNEFDIICGRGRGLYKQKGNRKFRAIVLEHIDEYKDAKTKLDKSTVVIKIVDTVLSQNNGNCRFVKEAGVNTWEVVGYDYIRDKIGHAIRECIAASSKRNLQKHDVRPKGGQDRKVWNLDADVNGPPVKQRRIEKNISKLDKVPEPVQLPYCQSSQDSTKSLSQRKEDINEPPPKKFRLRIKIPKFLLSGKKFTVMTKSKTNSTKKCHEISIVH